MRLGDHAGLEAAARHGEVVPALVLDPALLARMAGRPRRAAYYCAAVSALARELEAHESRLLCRRGPAAKTVVRLARDAHADAVAWSVAYDHASLAAQQRLQTALEEAGLRVFAVHDAAAVAPEETAAARPSEGGRGYRAFAPYYQVWSALPRETVPATGRYANLSLPSDALPGQSDFALERVAADAGRPPAGHASERAARRCLDDYLAAPALVYRAARDVPSGPPTSRLSAALSFGTIAARTVLAAIDARARDRFLLTEERLALKAFRRSLAQRDFFLQLAWFFGAQRDAPLQTRMARFRFARSHRALDAWRKGRTGYPFVDAGIRQLRETGWMHPRARVVAASFLCFDLGVDWRVGRDLWERDLEEDDAALATGNWQWIAGVGADLAQFPRIYNPRKQARAYDAAGSYIRRWIPELRGRPVPGLSGTPLGRDGAQLGLPLFDDAAYPEPVVDHETAAREFLRRYDQFRASAW